VGEATRLGRHHLIIIINIIGAPAPYPSSIITTQPVYVTVIKSINQPITTSM
jgi:hypothetical protein